MGRAARPHDQASYACSPQQLRVSEGEGGDGCDFDLRGECSSISVEVPRRDRLCAQFVVPPGCTLRWEVQVLALDVGFELALREQADGGAAETPLRPPRRIQAGELTRGCATVPSAPAGAAQGDASQRPRAVVLSWDNSFSLVRRKHVEYRAIVGKTRAEKGSVLHPDADRW